MKTKFFKYKIYIIALTVVLIQLTSCKKAFLDQKPYTSLPAADAVKTVSDLKVALNGAYSGLRSVTTRGETVPVLGDLLADNTFLSSANYGTFNNENAYTITTDAAFSNNLWNGGYKVILAVNNIIDSPLNTGLQVEQYKGEAYAIRALIYFDMVRMFAKAFTTDPKSPGVPIVVHYDPQLLPARNTVEEVYNQILADLDKAINLLGVYNGSATFSKYAAIALSSKVNLYKGDFQKAYLQGMEVVNNSGFSLLARENFLNYWASATPHDAANKEETFLEIVSDGTNNNSFNELANLYVQDKNTSGVLLTVKSLYDSYSISDIRKNLILLGQRAAVGGENPAYLVNKYPLTSGDYNDKKVIRFSDVLLTVAEAACRLGRQQEGLNLLNQLIKQRDPLALYTSTGQTLLNDIINERRKELAFEGDRFFDLNRLNQAIQRTTEYPTGPIPAGDSRRVMPIPQSEILVNRNMVQNAGY